MQDLLLSGEYAIGTPLVEAKLAAELGVSRTPVREALTRLEEDGLVETHGSGKRRVADLRAKVADVFQIRLKLEPFAAGLAAHRMTGADIDELRSLQTHIERLMENWEANSAQVQELNSRFHRMIVNHCGNQSLIDVLVRLAPFSVFPKILTHYSNEDRDTAFREHRVILDALWRRDAAEVEKMTLEHLTRGANAIQIAMR